MSCGLVAVSHWGRPEPVTAPSLGNLLFPFSLEALLLARPLDELPARLSLPLASQSPAPSALPNDDAPLLSPCLAPHSLQQQLQAHQLSQLQALALPLTPLPVGLQPPALPAVSAGTGLLSLSALGSQAHLSKEDKNGHDGDAHQDDEDRKSVV